MENSSAKENHIRILEAFAYIAERAPKKNTYNLLKVFYLADKLHMERYGRFIFDDTYAAMPKGPVPSLAYDLIKCIRDNRALPLGLKTTIQVGKNHLVVPVRHADEDIFSDSDLECIDEIITLSATKDLGDLSHDQAWKETKPNKPIPIELIIRTLEHSESLLELHNNRHP